MSEFINEDWALRYALIVSAGALGLALVSYRLPAVDKPDLAGVKALLLGVGGVILILAIVPILGGTTPADLLDGWLIRPAGTADFHAALLINASSWLWVLAGLLAAAAITWAWGRPLGRLPQLLAPAGRLLAGLVIWIALAGPVFDLPTDLTQGLVIGAPLLWVAAIAPRGKFGENSFLRLLIPSVAALQLLHAFPMPGSQLNWSIFLLVVVGGICIADGLEEFAALEVRPSWGPILKYAPLLAVLAFGAWLCLKPLRTEARAASDRYDAAIPLELPGAENMRVTPPLAFQLRELSAGIRENCEALLTLPGMSSLNFLSEVEAPVELSSPWPFFFTAEEQERIVKKAGETPGLCVVRKPDLVDFWAGFYGSEPPRYPLLEYMDRKFRPIHDYSGYILTVRR